MTDPRALTTEEARELFLKAVRGCISYWSAQKGMPAEDRCEGVAFSILNLIDGTSGQYPVALDLVARPHPSDQKYLEEQGDNWHEDGTVLNADVLLHEVFYRKAEQ